MHDGNREYYRMRAQEERRRADRATGSAARSHLILAGKYEWMADSAPDSENDIA